MLDPLTETNPAVQIAVVGKYHSSFRRPNSNKVLVQLDGVTVVVSAESVDLAKILHADLNIILHLAGPHGCSSALLVCRRKHEVQRIIDDDPVPKSANDNSKPRD